jgi:hypothetical protein
LLRRQTAVYTVGHTLARERKARVCGRMACGAATHALPAQEAASGESVRGEQGGGDERWRQAAWHVGLEAEEHT